MCLAAVPPPARPTSQGFSRHTQTALFLVRTRKPVTLHSPGNIAPRQPSRRATIGARIRRKRDLKAEKGVAEMTPRRSRGQKNTDDDFWRRHCQAALRSSRTLTRASLSSPPTNWRERDRHCHCRHPMRQQTQVQTRPSRLHLRHADPDSDADAAGVSPVVVDNTKLRATSGSTPTNGVDLRTLITPMDQAMQESLLGNTNARQVTVASAAGETSSIPGSGGQRTNKADSIVSAGTAESPLDADSHKWTLMAVESINRTLSACQPSEEGEG
eukprot:CAMPEP_0184483476 /NCGR_PEP_ID=MMETSP0113_2-20130426/5125_1 /TAXON_ID=91329 /ORGANISM="Norrisiella sphaerica, Strain BC52" /LENGTH=270 /DNA_ID=CAMNT_0026863895 /DNA_START=174 /DNA_END=982 /DNA_ORIENTATION=+